LLKTLDEIEVVRLLKKHSSAESLRIFTLAWNRRPELVTVIMNYCFTHKEQLNEAAVVVRLERVIYLIKHQGTA